MNISYATIATPGRENEDFVVTGPDWGIVLDGATAPPGIDSGCIHNVPWLVRNLAASMVNRLLSTGDTLPEIVATAIESTRDSHASTCDISNPASPSSTVAILRRLSDDFDYLVLADSPIVFDAGDEDAYAILDDRTDHLPSYAPEDVRDCRNVPGGFWVASTNPEAAYQSINGQVAAKGFKRAALLTDGSARYVQRFRLSDWNGLLDLLQREGPTELIRRVRDAEAAETDEDREREKRRGKQHDDATAVLLQP